MVRVLVIADDQDVRKGLRRLFEASGQTDVVFSATDEPCRGAAKRPDVVVIDTWPLAMGQAVEVTRAACRTFTGVSVIVLAHHITPQVRTAIKEAGGHAVWPKDDAVGLVGFARHLAELRNHDGDD